MRKTTKRYVVAPGIEADLCDRCWLAPVEIRELTADQRDRLAGERLELSHAEYTAIHPHDRGAK